MTGGSELAGYRGIIDYSVFSEINGTLMEPVALNLQIIEESVL